jgi:serine/threonine protein kinase
LVLGPEQGDHERLALAEAGADELLSSSPPTRELIRAVERVAAIPHQSSAPSPLPVGRQLTAEEIFGDILSEVDSKADLRIPAPISESAPEASEDAVGVEVESETLESGSASVAGVEAHLFREDSASEIHSTVESGVEDRWPFEEPLSSVEATPSRSEFDILGSAVPEQLSREVESTGFDERPDSDFGQYRLEERIAVGGMAEVWRASMVGLEGFRKTVAIKKILPHLAENQEFVAMFVDEAKLAAQLSHENLVDIYDPGKIDGEFFIAMEYVEGRDLRSILNRLRQRRETMPLGLAFFIAARIAAGLDYAHTRLDADGKPLGLVHRDVSPRNILISHNGNVRLCDFGVAKAVSSVARTEIGALKGKIQYMSPEQAAGAHVDSRSDVFSLGSVLFEMVTGRRLFVEDTEITLLDAVRRGATDEPRSVRKDLPDDFNAILVRALIKDPESRYQTADQMQRELDETLFHLEPKPTQGALAQWLGEVFEEPTEPDGAFQADAASDQATASAVSRADVSEEAVLDMESPGDQKDRAEPVETSGEEATAETKVNAAPDRLWRKFWIGVAAGLLVAVLTALAIGSWLDRKARSVRSPVPVSDEVGKPLSGVRSEAENGSRLPAHEQSDLEEPEASTAPAE